MPNSPDLKQREIGAIQDAQRAIKLIRANAIKWGIKPDKIGIQGSSAGGHLAAATGNQTTDFSAVGDAFDTVSFRPNFTILVSPVIDLGKHTHAGSRKNLLGENPSQQLIEKYSNQLQVN